MSFFQMVKLNNLLTFIKRVFILGWRSGEIRRKKGGNLGS